MISRRLFHRLPPTIHQLLSEPSPSQTVTVNGWIKSIRKQKKVTFAVVSDGSDHRGLQVVFSDPNPSKGLANGTAVHIKGELVRSPAAGQEKELQVKEIEVLGESDIQSYPIQKQSLSTEYLRDYIHLRARTDRVAAMLRLRSGCARALGTYFENRDFIHVHTPVLTANDCEGAGETFRLSPVTPHPDAENSPSVGKNGVSAPTEFFSQPAHLSVSAQLHLEALAWAMGRVYTLGPCFRAERSMTGRHLAEFWMLEAEWNLDNTPANGLEQVCDAVELAAKDVLSTCLIADQTSGRMQDDVVMLWKDSQGIERKKLLDEAARMDKPWLRLSYTDAIKVLQDANPPQAFRFKPQWGSPLQSEHERYLAESVAKGPIFVHDYPASIKPFYMRRNSEDQTVSCFDLLVPGIGELAGGSVREERQDVLERTLRDTFAHDKGEKWRQEYGWYLDLRRYGGSPHGGFGLGFERFISWISGIDNVRECIPMPRWAGRLLL